MQSANKAKIIVPAAVFCVTLAGQVLHGFVLRSLFCNPCISYSLIIALASCFIIDFVTASGLLQRKIFFIKLLVIYFVLLVAINRIVLTHIEMNTYPYKISLATTVLFVVIIVLTDTFHKSDKDFTCIRTVDQLPKKYLRSRPVLFILETIFRLFPVPEPVALYKIGSPYKSSPVIVTGNYELTVRRVARSLSGLNCWLLVCDSRGINIWCSTLSGHFSEQDIIEAFLLTKTAEHAPSKRLVLPQLSAPGVDIREIKQKTGFSATFGPVYSENIREFLSSQNNDLEIRRVKFGLRGRLEMAFGCPMILTGVLLFIYLFIDLSRLVLVLPGLYLISVLLAVLYPYRPLKKTPLWALLWFCLITAGILGFTIVTGLFQLRSITTAVTAGFGTFYLINEFEGWSPLIKYNFRSMYGGVRIPEITVDEKLCIGCRLCTDVCPKGVFVVKETTSHIVHGEDCIECTACFVQCPKNAIIHSADKRKREPWGVCSSAQAELQN